MRAALSEGDWDQANTLLESLRRFELNVVCAGFAGVIVPVALQIIKFDPAYASPILVTRLMDALGYLFYLGLATLLITNIL
jgi:magnesium transporter